jgi:hypothetical protein
VTPGEIPGDRFETVSLVQEAGVVTAIFIVTFIVGLHGGSSDPNSWPKLEQTNELIADHILCAVAAGFHVLTKQIQQTSGSASH